MIFYKIIDKRTGTFVRKSGARMYQTVTYFDGSHNWDSLEKVQKSVKYFRDQARKNIKSNQKQLKRLTEQVSRNSGQRKSWIDMRIKNLKKDTENYLRGIEDFEKHFQVVKYETIKKEVQDIPSVMESKIKDEVNMLSKKPLSKEEDIIDGI